MARLICFVFLLVSALPRLGLAELMPRFAPGFGPEIRKLSGVQTYRSGNGLYELVMDAPAGTWSLKKRGHVLWSKPLPHQPGAAAVSDDGERITQPIWQFVDEVHSYCSGIVFYDKNGAPGRTIHFMDGWRNLLLSADYFAISPDGTAIVVGSNGKPHSELTMIEVANGRKRWGVSAGYGTVVAVGMTAGGTCTLMATHDDRDMEFVLLDRDGNLLWQRTMAGNFSPELRSYLRFDRDDKGFSVYDLSSGKFQRFTIPESKSDAIPEPMHSDY